MLCQSLTESATVNVKVPLFLHSVFDSIEVSSCAELETLQKVVSYICSIVAHRRQQKRRLSIVEEYIVRVYLLRLIRSGVAFTQTRIHVPQWLFGVRWGDTPQFVRLRQVPVGLVVWLVINFRKEKKRRESELRLLLMCVCVCFAKCQRSFIDRTGFISKNSVSESHSRHFTIGLSWEGKKKKGPFLEHFAKRRRSSIFFSLFFHVQPNSTRSPPLSIHLETIWGVEPRANFPAAACQSNRELCCDWKTR